MSNPIANTVSSVIRAACGDSIGLALRRTAALWRDDTALIFKNRSWSFAGLDAAADRIAAWMADTLGAREGERIACYGCNSDAYLLAWLGCVRGGFIHVPINYALAGKELEYILDQSSAKILLHDVAQTEAVERDLQGRDTPAHALIDAAENSVLSVALATHRVPQRDPSLGTGDLAQIMYTSGTTSLPKGAMMTHGAMLAEYGSCIEALDFDRHDRSLAALPLYHAAQMHALSMPQLLVGARSVLIEAPAPTIVLETIEREKITSFFAPPTVWISLLRHADFERRDLGSLRKLYYGASIMPAPILAELRSRLPGAGTYNAYGQTEIAPLATVLRPEEHAERPTSAGRPVRNVQTRIVDEHMNDVPVGERGEIVHRSPQLCTGYWDKPAETAQAFAGGWFHSGDIGYMDAAGYLYIVDRLKDVINSGGVLVASREIEDAIFELPVVAEVAVIGTPHAKWIEAITAVVVLREGATCAEAEIVGHVRGRLAAFKVPKSVIFVPALPKNASGKILKRELRLLVTGKVEVV